MAHCGWGWKYTLVAFLEKYRQRQLCTTQQVYISSIHPLQLVFEKPMKNPRTLVWHLPQRQRASRKKTNRTLLPGKLKLWCMQYRLLSVLVSRKTNIDFLAPPSACWKPTPFVSEGKGKASLVTARPDTGQQSMGLKDAGRPRHQTLLPEFQLPTNLWPDLVLWSSLSASLSSLCPGRMKWRRPMDGRIWGTPSSTCSTTRAWK